ncbi:uncharacterized protein RB166_019474 [Leptodactylus fuscus]
MSGVSPCDLLRDLIYQKEEPRIGCSAQDRESYILTLQNLQESRKFVTQLPKGVDNAQHKYRSKTHSILYTLPNDNPLIATGVTESCNDILDCVASPDTDWNDGIFCHSVFSSSRRFQYVNCSWLPYTSSVSSKTRYKLYVDYPALLECDVMDTYDTSMILHKNSLLINRVTTIWVSYEISDQLCVKTNNFSILPNVDCKSPNIQHAVHSESVLRFHLDDIGQVRYREITSSQWHTINVTYVASVSLSGTLLLDSYVMQHRRLHEFCFHCKWEPETNVPHELLGAPDIIVTTEKLSPGRQRLTIEWKYTSHDYVDGYNVMIHRIPNSCHYIIAFSTTDTIVHRNLSVGFFNVSVTAYNKAGRSRSASSVAAPLATPELPGRLSATYENNTIFLRWSPSYDCDFVVINWGTSYSQMESKTIMDKIENYNIPGPFEAMKRYMIMIYLYDSCECKDSTKEITFGLTYMYTVEGVPRTGPRDVTVKSVTKTSAIVEWKEIPEDDCLGFLLGYQISCTDTSRDTRMDIFLNDSSHRHYHIEGLTGGHTYEVKVSGVTVAGAGAPSGSQVIQTLSYGEAELRIIITVTCAGLIICALILVKVCACTAHRAKNWYFQEIPNPKHSHIVRINEAVGLHKFPTLCSCFTFQTLLMHSPSPDEEESCFDQLGVEVTQQTSGSRVQEMDKGVLQKTSNHQRTTHAYGAKAEDYTSMMSVLKVFQRFPETTRYLRQQPTAVQK